MMECLLGSKFGFRKFLLVDDETDAGFVGGKRDDPEPFVSQTNDDCIEAVIDGRKIEVLEVAEDRDFLVARMNDTKAFLVAGKVAAAAGIDEEGGAELVGLALRG